MNRMRMMPWALALMLLAPQTVWAEELQEAGDEDVTVTSNSGPPPKTLAERIPAVTSRVFVKEGRVELALNLGTTVNDPFYTHAVPGVSVAYYVFESLWVGASGDFHVGIQSKQSVPNAVGLEQPELNRPQYTARLEAGWVPFYGKLSLLAETVLHFDTYVALGGGIVGATDSGSTFAGSFAIGEHIFLNDFLALRLELRDQIFQMSRNPGRTDKTLQNFLSVSVGIGFFVPPSFERVAL